MSAFITELEAYAWLEDWDLVLGSQSPRRVELLSGLGLRFRQEAMPDIDERYPKDLPLAEVASYLSRHKAEAYRPSMQEKTIVLTADTTVLVGDRLLGKPKSDDEALEYLRLLEGGSHEVITGITLCTTQTIWTASDKSVVHFAPLSDDELRYYIKHYRPSDKAGAYGIQEWIGYRAISRIEGSFFTIMGLPIHLVLEGLRVLRP